MKITKLYAANRILEKTKKPDGQGYVHNKEVRDA